MGWLAEILALVLASAFTGAAFYINFAEHPARMTLAAEAALAQWKLACKRGFFMQASLALLGALASFAAAYASQDWRWLLAGAVLAANWPYTLIVMTPLNKALTAAAPADTAQLERWNSLCAARTLLGAASAMLMIWIVMT